MIETLKPPPAGQVRETARPPEEGLRNQEMYRVAKAIGATWAREGLEGREPWSLDDRLRQALARGMAWLVTTGWRVMADWRALGPVLTRYTAHLTVLLLALAVLLLVGTDFSPTSVTPPSLTLSEHALQRPAALPASSLGHVGGPSKPVGVLASPPMEPPSILTRMAVPTTTIPVRPRRDVITYTVQPGDTIFGIAGAFGLAPETIYWANSETLHDNPHLLRPGMVLYILPTDGIYHTVQAGETIEGLAEKYGVEPEAILNAEWNHLKRGQPLQEGQKLVIPGGKREFVVWQLPKYASSGVRGRGNTGLCRGPFTGGIIGRGIFTWPTAGRRISGWYFRDRRNPAHGGIDIGLRLGDPVYAADNGLVVYAGWNTWGYGNLVVIDHGNGWQTWYAHLSQVNVSCGQSVWQGGIIGLGGSTGNSTGPHLHFESRYEGKPADPLSLLP